MARLPRRSPQCPLGFFSFGAIFFVLNTRRAPVYRPWPRWDEGVSERGESSLNKGGVTQPYRGRGRGRDSVYTAVPSACIQALTTLGRRSERGECSLNKGGVTQPHSRGSGSGRDSVYTAVPSACIQALATLGRRSERGCRGHARWELRAGHCRCREGLLVQLVPWCRGCRGGESWTSGGA
jgi:hypothetical protein